MKLGIVENFSQRFAQHQRCLLRRSWGQDKRLTSGAERAKQQLGDIQSGMDVNGLLASFGEYRFAPLGARISLASLHRHRTPCPVVNFGSLSRRNHANNRPLIRHHGRSLGVQCAVPLLAISPACPSQVLCALWSRHDWSYAATPDKQISGDRSAPLIRPPLRPRQPRNPDRQWLIRPVVFADLRVFSMST